MTRVIYRFFYFALGAACMLAFGYISQKDYIDQLVIEEAHNRIQCQRDRENAERYADFLSTLMTTGGKITVEGKPVAVCYPRKS